MEAEASWILETAERDENALRSLYDALGRNVFALAHQMLGSREDAEEVVQDTFVKVYTHAARFRPEQGSARAWIYTIARNECRMRLRRRAARPRHDGDTDVHEPAGTLAATPTSPPPEVRLDVARALDQLEPDDARLLSDAFLQGFSHAQVAERSGMPLGTVKSRIRRALLKLRRSLGGEHVDDFDFEERGES